MKVEEGEDDVAARLQRTLRIHRRPHSALTHRSSRSHRTMRSTNTQGSGGSRPLAHRDLLFTVSDQILERRSLVFLDPSSLDTAFRSSTKYIPEEGVGARLPLQRRYMELKEKLKTHKLLLVPAAHFVNNVNPTRTAAASVFNKTLLATNMALEQANTPENCSKMGMISAVHITSGSVVFCVLRDMEVPAIPFLVPNEEANSFKIMFGVEKEELHPDVDVQMHESNAADFAPWRESKRYEEKIQKAVNEVAAVISAGKVTYDCSTISDKRVRFSTSEKDAQEEMKNRKELETAQSNINYFVEERTLEGRTIMYLNPKLVEPAFQMDRKYVGMKGKKSRRIRSEEEYINVMQRLLKSKVHFPIPCAELLELSSVDDILDSQMVEFCETDVVRFISGSHLFAVLRDFQCPAIPVVVHQEEADTFLRDFGCEDEILDNLKKATEEADEFVKTWRFPVIRVEESTPHPWRKHWNSKNKKTPRIHL